MERFSVVVPSFQAGGAERVAIHLAHGLVAAGRDVELVVLDGRGPLRRSVTPPVRLVDLGRTRARTAAAPLLRHLRARRPDVVLATQTHLNLLVALLRPGLRGTRVVLREPTVRGLRADGGLRPVQRVMRRAYRGTAAVVASSEAMAHELRHVLGAGGPPVLVLPNPVDVAAARTAAAARPAARPRGREFVVAGRLIPSKAVDEAVELFARVAAPDDRMTVVGDGPERARLTALSGRLGVASRVRFLGHLEDPWADVAAADALVLPSYREGMPNVVLEALAVGTPVVATTDLPAVTDLAREAPRGAVRCVERSRLGPELAAVAADPAARPRPSLLPDRFHRDEVVRRLLDALGPVG